LLILLDGQEEYDMTKYYYNREGLSSSDQQLLQQQQQQHLHSDSRSYNPYLSGSYPMQQPPPQGLSPLFLSPTSYLTSLQCSRDCQCHSSPAEVKAVVSALSAMAVEAVVTS
jgi:hypothetical protein